MKITRVIILIVLLIFLCTIPVYAEFEIDDPALFDAMKQYDLNDDGIIAVNEFNSVMLTEGSELVLDGYNISSLRALINKVHHVDKLFMRNCGFEKLPDGIDDVYLRNIHLENNKLADVDELYSLINKKHDIKTYVYIKGNPCAEEIIFKDFNYRFNNLSIVGAVGEIYWQKTNDRSELKVDCMDAGIIDDVTFVDTVIGEADFTEMKWEFSIEDESIARIEGETLIERDFEYDYEKYASTSIETLNYYRHQFDSVITIKLLKEGTTRMKITCGNLVKYTDIIVLPEHTNECGVYAIPRISDLEMLKVIRKYTMPTYSGIYRNAFEYFNKEHLILNANDGFIKDFSAFSDMDKIQRLTFSQYTVDMFKQVTNINDIPELYCLEVYNSPDETASELYQYIDENITSVKGTSWATINNKNHIKSRVLDINDDERISSRDALSVLKFVVGLLELDESHIKIADVNEDTIINANDALEILKVVAKIK